MKLSSGTELDMLDVIGKGDLTENAQDEDIAEAADGAAVASQNGVAAGFAGGSSQGQQQQSQPKKIVVGRRAKAVDDWEAAAEDEAYADDMAKKEAEEDGAWDDDDHDGSGKAGKKGNDRGLLQVLKALQRLKTEFDTTFHKMWA